MNFKILHISEATNEMLVDWCDGHPPQPMWIPEGIIDGSATTEREIELYIETFRPVYNDPVVVPPVLTGMLYVEPQTKIDEAKEVRATKKAEPIYVRGLMFDGDGSAQRNIMGAVRKFETLDAATRGDGTIDWTLYDNSIWPATKELLIAVEDAIAVRTLEAHKEYTISRLQIEAESEG